MLLCVCLKLECLCMLVQLNEQMCRIYCYLRLVFTYEVKKSVEKMLLGLHLLMLYSYAVIKFMLLLLRLMYSAPFCGWNLLILRAA